MSSLQSVRAAWKRLSRRPGFTLVAVVVLAIGIGSTTAIFTLVDAVLLRPLPYPEAERLVRVWESHPELGEQIPVAPANFLDWRRRAESFDGLAGYVGPEAGIHSMATLVGGGEPVRLQGTGVTPDFFSVLGVDPAIGRGFGPEEVGPGRDGVVVLSDGLWRRRFGGERSILGQSLEIDGKPRTVVGVMPPGFAFPTREVELWVPFGFDLAERRQAHMLQVVGRLAEGVSEAAASSELEAVAARLAEEYPDTNTAVTVGLAPLREVLVGDTRPTLLTLLAAVAFVLLISAANVGNLLLGRAAQRGREVAIRTALGASQRSLLADTVLESLLLGVLGGAAGVALAWSAVRTLPLWNLSELPLLETVSLDYRVLLFALGVTLLTALLAGVIPVLQSSLRPDLTEPLKEGGRQSLGSRGRRLRKTLVVVELAVSVTLVIAAGLLLKSYATLQQVEPGFEDENLLTFGLSLPRSDYSDPYRVIEVWQRLVAEIASLPGVEEVGAAPALPLTGLSWSGDFTVEGQPPPPAGAEPKVINQETTPGYFAALGVPLIEGRDFTSSDDIRSTLVTIVNRTFARRYLGGEDEAVGRRVKFARFDSDSPYWTVVGVAGDIRQSGLGDAVEPEVYRPITQDPTLALSFAVRTRGAPRTVLADVRNVVHQLDPKLPVFDVATGEELLAGALARQRFSLYLLLGFAGVAFLLAVIGIYGVMAFSVRQQTHEVGIRMALGASQRDVVGRILRQGLALVLLALPLGLIGAYLFSRLLSSLLFEVSGLDPWVYLGVAVLLSVIALLACWQPARHAARIDPLLALRRE